MPFGLIKTSIRSYLRFIKCCVKIKEPESSFLSVGLNHHPMSSIIFTIIGTTWFCEKMHIDIKLNFPLCDDLVENPQLLLSKSQQNKSFIRPIKLPFYNFFIEHAKGSIPSDEGYKLLSKFTIRKKFQRQVDEWLSSNIQGDWLGVHYRGTDINYHRYRRIEIEDYVAYLSTVIDKQHRIFACSDREQFIEQIHAAFPGRVFSKDIARSTDKTAIHRGSEHAGAQQKEDAFMDILILSKAPLIYTTGSYFIDVIRFLNPAIKIISLDGRKRCYKNIGNYHSSDYSIWETENKC